MPDRNALIQQFTKDICDENDDYRDTIFAILGFCNLWSYNSKTQRNNGHIELFQGRHLSKNIGGKSGNQVCPDLGIVINSDRAILGEIKKTSLRIMNCASRRFLSNLFHMIRNC